MGRVWERGWCYYIKWIVQVNAERTLRKRIHQKLLQDSSVCIILHINYFIRTVFLTTIYTQHHFSQYTRNSEGGRLVNHTYRFTHSTATEKLTCKPSVVVFLHSCRCRMGCMDDVQQGIAHAQVIQTCKNIWIKTEWGLLPSTLQTVVEGHMLCYIELQKVVLYKV